MADAAASSSPSPFHVPWLLHHLGGCVHRWRRLFVALGRLESRSLADALAAVPVTMPVYVCGLARSGSTLLHEILASHPGVATHRARDYPMVYTPCWWRQATARRRAGASPPRERAHGDRVLITSESPEALEEMIWMAFFPSCHDPGVSHLVGAGGDEQSRSHHADFAAFYHSHIRKLLLAERATRYVAKANYHVARLPYLLRLFPDARLVIPVREPVGHIASLARQHQRFCDAEKEHPRALAHMQRAGHFEFGLDRRPMNLGDTERVRQIERAWATPGEEARGWALYWAMVYDYLAELLASDDQVRSASLVVRFEDMCDKPAETIEAVLRHCGLPETGRVVEAFAPRISRPDYYQSSLSPEDVGLIRELTAAAAARWGYDGGRN